VTGRQTREFVSRAKDAGAIVYYDINFRKNHPAERTLFEANIALADIVRGSSEDIECLYGSSDAAGVYKEFIAPLCPNFICTRGGEDAEVFSPGVYAAFPTAPIEKVVSTIGAGDNFNAGIIYGLVRNAFSRQDVKALRREDWEVLVPVAMKFSANVCGSLFNYVDTDFADSI
jgi:fructokinase